MAFYILLIVNLLFAAPQTKTIVLTKSNHCVIDENIDKESMNNARLCVKNKKFRQKYNKPVYLVINTEGGSVKEGLAFIKFIQSYKNVHTITLDAASMGFGIVQGVPGKRFVVKNAKMFTHPMQVLKGRSPFIIEKFKQWLIDLVKLSNDFHNVIIDRSGIDSTLYYSKISNEKNNYEWEISLEEMFKYNFADELVAVYCDADLKAKKQKTIYTSLFGDIPITGHSCPLLPGYVK